MIKKKREREMSDYLSARPSTKEKKQQKMFNVKTISRNDTHINEESCHIAIFLKKKSSPVQTHYQ